MNFKQIASCLSLLLCSLTSPTPLYADIATDGTVGAAQNLTGPDYAIPETLGTVKGNNLFHSFEKFSIKTQESATFTGSDSIKNVISRVTGGDKSEIDGTFRSNVGKADFYFINPSGVVFGQNAKVDVPAAFHISTTDELKFADGASFKASKPEQSTLTQAAPESFGFLGKKSASIEVNGTNIEINGSTLSFAPQSSVSLTSSKDITINGTEDKPSALVSKGGQITLKASGDLVMDSAKVDVSDNGGGKINVKAGDVKLHNKSTISADNTGDKNTSDKITDSGIEIVVDKSLEITNGSRIQSNVYGNGDSGTIRVDAENMLIQQQENEAFTGVFIEVQPGATGNGKSVDVNVKNNLTIQGLGEIFNTTYGEGNAGDINVSTFNLLMNGEGINADLPYLGAPWSAAVASISTEPESDGKAGTITVNATGRIDLVHGAAIASMTFSKGDAGNVKIKAGNIRIDGQSDGDLLSGITSMTSAEGNAGKIEIIADGMLEVLNYAMISAETIGISANGNAGDIIIKAGNVILENKSLIDSGAFFDATGYVGSISVDSDSITLLDNSNISIEATTYLSEDKLLKMTKKNSINLDTGYLYLDQASSITSVSSGNLSASDININAETIFLHYGFITTSVQGKKGNGGDIIITGMTSKIPADFLIMKEGFIQANTMAEKANGGNITIHADALIKEANTELQIGGNEIKRFTDDRKVNVVKAAAPEGNPGNISYTPIQLDMSGSITNMSPQFTEQVQLATNPCRVMGTVKASSLIQERRGGFAEMPSYPSSISFGGERLDNLLLYKDNQ